MTPALSNFLEVCALHNAQFAIRNGTALNALEEKVFTRNSERITLETLEADQFGPELVLSETTNGEDCAYVRKPFTGF